MENINIRVTYEREVVHALISEFMEDHKKGSWQDIVSHVAKSYSVQVWIIRCIVGHLLDEEVMVRDTNMFGEIYVQVQ
jgi:hypothetical protein